jgi:hypothetical protein
MGGRGFGGEGGRLTGNYSAEALQLRVRHVAEHRSLGERREREQQDVGEVVGLDELLLRVEEKWGGVARVRT